MQSLNTVYRRDIFCKSLAHTKRAPKEDKNDWTRAIDSSTTCCTVFDVESQTQCFELEWNIILSYTYSAEQAKIKKTSITIGT